MLSILIRTYRDPVFDIVYEINEQCQKLDLTYEILISDDDPQGENLEEEKLSGFPNLTYWKNQSNLGRSNNLNTLIRTARFDYVLLLDNDVIPLRKNFMSSYLKAIEHNCKVAYGGLTYADEPPQTSQLLRWLYGHKREAKSVKIRKETYKYEVLVSNLLIDKSAFQQPIFDAELTSYGYEDLVFSEELKAKNLGVCHLDNPVVHKGLETSAEFLIKTETALLTLKDLIDRQKISENATSLSRLYFKMKSTRTLPLFLIALDPFQHKIRKHLISKQPRLFWFNVYKLYYFSKQFQDK
ncbi:glycosyltransferase [Psychroflexus sp. CAK1W]|uniref:glycosyltransferase n=1 Tax=Psychroflexus curvus TaxID=2873595 RepID=UPI001CCBC621|nr:glycosyltransferase [Psychroflexus curvus]MBZ9626553.1 glycosyltransferase [Psychroflexus curvus]